MKTLLAFVILASAVVYITYGDYLLDDKSTTERLADRTRVGQVCDALEEWHQLTGEGYLDNLLDEEGLAFVREHGFQRALVAPLGAGVFELLEWHLETFVVDEYGTIHRSACSQFSGDHWDWFLVASLPPSHNGAEILGPVIRPRDATDPRLTARTSPRPCSECFPPSSPD